MKVVIAGASGFLGGALRESLTAAGHQLTQLVRREPDQPSQRRWDPQAGVVDLDAIAAADVVVNLAGAPVAHWPWTDAYRRELRDSRVLSTQTLARAIAAVDRPPALVNASAIGVYGDRGEELLDEDSPLGTGFLAELVAEWESATAPAAAAGGRVVVFRTGIVLHRSGGALKLARVPFSLGLGGQIGDGRQYFSTVSLRDYTRAVASFVEEDTRAGTYNVSGPTPATNAEFTQALGRTLRRPTLLRVPAFGVRLLGADLSREALGSIRVVPRRLLDAGFRFDHATVDDQLQAALTG